MIVQVKLRESKAKQSAAFDCQGIAIHRELCIHCSTDVKLKMHLRREFES